MDAVERPAIAVAQQDLGDPELAIHSSITDRALLCPSADGDRHVPVGAEVDLVELEALVAEIGRASCRERV